MIYNYLKYKDFVKFKITSNKEVRGYQTLLAKAAGCQRPYISQVLNGDSDLSLEQSAGLALYWQLDDQETEYFLSLVQYARAGTKQLKKIIKSKIDQYKRDQENLSKRFNQPGVDSLSAQAKYYSSWSWAAVHILITIPEFDSVEKIAKRLNLSLSVINTIVSGLLGMGLIKKYKSSWRLTEMHIHLPKDSPFNAINHANWRNRAVEDAMVNNRESLHYSGVHSLSLEDFEKVKNICLKSIDDIHQKISPSPEEELVYLGLDFFKI